MSNIDIEKEVSSVRTEFEQIREEFAVDSEKSSEDVIILEESDVLFRVIGSDMDFNLGKEVMGIQTEAPSYTTRIIAKEVKVHGKKITMEGLRDHEQFEVFP